MQKIWENENTICLENGNIQYLQFKKLLEYSNLKHCYTLRGKENLNFPPVNKDEKTLIESYKKICGCLDLDFRKVMKPHQTHTTNVEKVDEVKNLENVDGVLTSKKDLVLITTSADCNSLLFYEPIQNVVGSVHSGWKGTLAGICINAVNKMVNEFNCKKEKIICCICPSIRSCCFEVDADVKEMFYEKYSYLPEISEIIKLGSVKQGKQKYNIDTVEIIKRLLNNMGLKEKNIIDSNICTKCNSNLFHSYRAEKEASGRNAALIAMI